MRIPDRFRYPISSLTLHYLVQKMRQKVKGLRLFAVNGKDLKPTFVVQNRKIKTNGSHKICIKHVRIPLVLSPINFMPVWLELALFYACCISLLHMFLQVKVLTLTGFKVSQLTWNETKMCYCKCTVHIRTSFHATYLFLYANSSCLNIKIITNNIEEIYVNKDNGTLEQKGIVVK